MMAASSDTGNWGPWAATIGEAERLARLRSLRAFVQMWGTTHPFYRALYFAESGEPEDLQAAALELDRLPALSRRHVLGHYVTLIGYRAQRSAEGR
jgi:hypothetical protein